MGGGEIITNVTHNAVQQNGSSCVSRGKTHIRAHTPKKSTALERKGGHLEGMASQESGN